MLRQVESIHTHPEADVAVVISARAETDIDTAHPDDAFWGFVSNLSLGEDFVSYGFPSEAPDLDDGPLPEGQDVVLLKSDIIPTPRLFRGYFQRYFFFPPKTKNYYLAGEMSIPAPAGLRGGPLFRPGAPPMLTGIVTGNLETFTARDSVEIEEKDGLMKRVETQRIISYGLCALLHPLADWLDGLVPPS